MVSKRIIGRLDIKNDFVIKGVQLEGLRKIGDPLAIGRRLYKEGADELLFMDAVASLYGRNNLFNIIEKACREIFVPITIGGGIRTLEDIQSALNSGADKVAINSAGIRNRGFLESAISKYGSQCIVGSVECKRKGEGWEAYIDNGREETGLDVLEWVAELESIGVGELIVTSIDADGTQKGMDMNLLKRIGNQTKLPLIVSGGVGALDHVGDALNLPGIDAVCIASSFHYNKFDIPILKQFLADQNFSLRV